MQSSVQRRSVFWVLTVIICLLLGGVVARAYPTSSAGSDFYLVPRTEVPSVTYVGSTAVMTFRSYIDKSDPQTRIPADGLNDVYLKRFFWVENASGTRLDDGPYFNNRTSGSGTEGGCALPYSPIWGYSCGWHESGAVAPTDAFCVTRSGASSPGCVDGSVKNDVYQTNQSLPTGYRVCSMALVVSHFGRANYATSFPPTADPMDWGDTATGYWDLWQNGALPPSAATARSQQSSAYGASAPQCFTIPAIPPPSSAFRIEPKGTTTVTIDGSGNVTAQFTAAVDKNHILNSIPAQGMRTGAVKRFFYVTTPGNEYTNADAYSDNFTGFGVPGFVESQAGNIWESSEGATNQNKCFSQSVANANAPICGPDQSTANDVLSIPAARAPAGTLVCMRVYLRYHFGTVDNSTGASTPTNPAQASASAFYLFTTPAAGLAAANAANSANVLSAPICATVPSPPVVLANPYFRVVGGDVLAGSGTFEGPTCTVTANAPIAAFNKGGPAYLGAAVQFASYATGRVTQFATAYQRTATPQVPRGLAFANTNGGNEYGGEVGNTPCAPDYYAQNTLTTTNWINSYTTGTYYSNGNVNLNSATIANGQRVVLYVNGDARISGNIIYANGGWSTATQIPSFYLIVRGNIYIDNNVSQLDGAYIAQQTAANTKGIIYTCTIGGGVPNAVQIANPALCGQTRLDVNGAFIGRQIKLLRTRGDLTTCTDLNSCQNSVAESFNYSPDVWLSAPLTGVTAAGGYDSITSLPPVL